MDGIDLATWAWVFVGSWFVWFSAALWSVRKPSLHTMAAFLLSFAVFIGVDVVYAIATEQYAFLVLPVILIAFSLSINKAADDASNNS